MINILLYIPPPYKISGGLGNFKLFFDICKQNNYSIFYCPLLNHIPSLGFRSPFNNIPIDSITNEQLINYYLNPDQPSEPINVKEIVTPAILSSRNNVVIYPENIKGNPAQQKYVVRWLFYFPIPEIVPHYNFETDYIWFYSDYIFNFYKYVCIACGVPDFLTKRISQLNICRVFKFEPDIYQQIQNNRIVNRDFNTNRKCFTLRKLFPPNSFNNRGIKDEYAKEIMIIYNKKIKKLQNEIPRCKNQIQIKNIINNINGLKRNPPNLNSDVVLREFLRSKFIGLGYEQIEHQDSSLKFIQYFQQKDYFLTFDPFTFMSIIASLCGCISVIKTIHGLSHEEWLNGDPFNKYGVAYGQNGITHALETQHLLLDHITKMYSENTNNVIHFLNSIENKFSIKLQK